MTHKVYIGEIVHVPGDVICRPAIVSESYAGGVIDAIVVQLRGNGYEPKLNYYGDLHTLSGDEKPLKNFYPPHTWHKPYECQLPQTTFGLTLS